MAMDPLRENERSYLGPSEPHYTRQSINTPLNIQNDGISIPLHKDASSNAGGNVDAYGRLHDGPAPTEVDAFLINTSRFHRHLEDLNVHSDVGASDDEDHAAPPLATNQGFLLNSTQWPNSISPDEVLHEPASHRFTRFKGKIGLVRNESVEASPSVSLLDEKSLRKRLFLRQHHTSSTALEFPTNAKYKAWQPLMLHRWVLLSFAVLYVLMIVVLELLYMFSQRNQGLSTSTWNLHYYWTYGPTAFLTVIMVFWHQVDYRIKQLQPWKLMAGGPTPSGNGVLLDYVSPMVLVALLKAMRKRHYPVLLSIMIDLSLKLLTILSTSLLVLQAVNVRHSGSPLVATSRFNGSSFNASNVGFSPALFAVAVTPEIQNPFPAWTQDGSAIPILVSTSELSAGAEAFVEVDAFVAELTNCETPTVSLTWGLIDTLPVTINGSSCKSSTELDAPVYANGSYNAAGGHLIQCSGNPYNSTGMSNNTEKLLLYYYQFEGDTPPSNSVWLVCDHVYSLQSALVTSDGNAGNTTWTVNTVTQSNKLIDGISPTDISNGVLDSLDSFSEVALNGLQSDYLSWIGLMGFLYPGVSPDAFFDAGRFESTMKFLYSNVAAQMAQQLIQVEATDRLYGYTMSTLERVVVRSLSKDLMEAVLGLLILLTLVLTFVVPIRVVPCDPGSIAGLSTILVDSHTLIKAMSGHGCSSTDVLEDELSSYKHNTWIAEKSHSPTFSIQSTLPPPISGHVLGRGNSRMHKIDLNQKDFWKPMAFGWSMVTLILSLPLVLIAALEVVLELSQRTNGIANVQSGSRIRYIWVYIPAFVMVVMDMIYGSLNFAVRVLQPYLELRRNESGAEKTVLENPLQRSTAATLITSITRHNIALLAISVAAFITPLLTVVVSGLFPGQDQALHLPIAVKMLDQFNSTFLQWAPESEPANIAATILQHDHSLAYPKWTYDTLAFPQMELDTADYSGNLSELTSLTVTVPAVRGKISCTNLPVEVVPIDATGFINVTANVAYRLYWPYITTPEYSRAIPAPTTGWEAFGTFDYPNCFSDSWFDNADFICNPTLPGPYGVAYYGIGNTTTQELVALECTWPYVEVVQTRVSFRLPDFTIDVGNPPVPDESTATFFSNQSFLPELFGYGLYSNATLGPMLYNSIFGRAGGEPREFYLDVDNLAPAVEYAYNAIAGQYLHVLFRTNISSAESSTFLEGTYTNPFNSRLVQSPVSTRILEGFFAVLFLCALVTYTTVVRSVRRLLPKNPCSIAAVTSLLAGSRLLSRDVIPEGAEWVGAKALAGGDYFGKHKVYGLGWWTSEGMEGRRRAAGREAEPLNDEYEDGEEGDAEVDELQTRHGERFGLDVGHARWRPTVDQS